MQYSDAVDAGVAVLDQKNPGWRGQVDLDILDMHNTRSCVLGQLYGSYWDGLEVLTGLHWLDNGSQIRAWAIGHGLQVRPSDFDDMGAMHRDYEELNRLWGEKIAA